MRDYWEHWEFLGFRNLFSQRCQSVCRDRRDFAPGPRFARGQTVNNNQIKLKQKQHCEQLINLATIFKCQKSWQFQFSSKCSIPVQCEMQVRRTIVSHCFKTLFLSKYSIWKNNNFIIKYLNFCAKIKRFFFTYLISKKYQIIGESNFEYFL